VAQAITYWDAWTLWFSGQEVPLDATMGPWTILTWGRVGKIVSFFGGATFILDLAGPERLRQLGRDLGSSRFAALYKGRRFWLAFYSGAIFLAATSFIIADYVDNHGLREPGGALPVGFCVVDIVFWILLALGLVIALLATTSSYMRILASVLDDHKPGQLIRYLAVLLLLVGFHLDLLAS
jgi:hypothetical protein